jgi:hypothetical protein
MTNDIQRNPLVFLSNATQFPLHILQKDLTKKQMKYLFVR